MWIAKFYDKNIPDLDTGCDNEQDAVEFVDGWCKDCNVKAQYELVWEN